MNQSIARASNDYTVAWADGTSRCADTYEEAVAIVEARYPEASIGHDGDLADGGERTLCWASEEDADNDDGADAVATIRVVGR